MTIRFAVPRDTSTTTPTAPTAIEQAFPHGSSMHILIQVAMKWTTETPSEEGRSQLVELLSHGIARFGNGSPTQNDETMLPIYRMLVRHNRSLVARGLLYTRLYEEKCYRHSAAFYRDWIEALMSEGNRAEAESIVDLARANLALPFKIINKCMERLAENTFDLRERALNALGDIHLPLEQVLRPNNAPFTFTSFTEEELAFVFSSTKMSEILVYLGSAVASPETLGHISERIGALRVLTYEVGAEEPK